MKRAVLTSSPSTDEGTFGMMVLDDGSDMHTLELPWRDNAPQISCIPAGTYLCELVWSPRFKTQLYGLRNVPQRSDILIHWANWAGDRAKGWKSELQGCIAPGVAVGVLNNHAGHPQRAVIQSRRALHDLMAWAAGQPFELEIRRSPTAPKGQP